MKNASLCHRASMDRAALSPLLRRRAPETVATRYRRLRVLYRWLEEEDEITANPMAKMKPPIIPSSPSRSCPRTAYGGC
jgi:site-specific recombinase XerC